MRKTGDCWKKKITNIGLHVKADFLVLLENQTRQQWKAEVQFNDWRQPITWKTYSYTEESYITTLYISLYIFIMQKVHETKRSRKIIWLVLLGPNYYRVLSLLTQVFILHYQASRQGQLQKSSNFHWQLKTWGEGGISAKGLTIMSHVMHAPRTTINHVFGLST